MRNDAEGSHDLQASAPPQRAGDAPDAGELLKADHEKVKELFARSESKSGSNKEGITSQILNELEMHARLEEEIFYPTVLEIDSKGLASFEEDIGDVTTDEIIDISYQEHQSMKELINELKTMDSKSDQYKERFAELMEGVLTHASEEEEVVFPAARLKLNLQEIGARMQIMKSSQISVSTDL